MKLTLGQAAGKTPGAVALPGGHLGVQPLRYQIDQAGCEGERCKKSAQAMLVEAVEKLADVTDGHEGASGITQGREAVKRGFHGTAGTVGVARLAEVRFEESGETRRTPPGQPGRVPLARGVRAPLRPVSPSG